MKREDGHREMRDGLMTTQYMPERWLGVHVMLETPVIS